MNTHRLNIASPKSKLRALALAAMAHNKIWGPPINLDDISAHIILQKDNSIYISFWDIDAYIRNDNPYYNDILKEIN